MSNNYTLTLVGILVLINIMWLMTSCVEAEMMGAMTASSSPLLEKQVIKQPTAVPPPQQQKRQRQQPTSTKSSKNVVNNPKKTTKPLPAEKKPFSKIKKPTPPTTSKPKKGTYTARKAKPNKIHKAPTHTPSLYLLDKAQKHIEEPHLFAQKVRKIAAKLEIPPEWIMAIIHSESNFKANRKNMKGSGAKGLIQFMPKTCKSLGMKKFPESAIAQLEFVYKYFQKCKKQRGEFRNLTDLKLSVLYPKAMGKADNYVLYQKPSIAYRQNKGLDKNRDGVVTVADVETYMKGSYAVLYN